ncbi:MAG TPA: SURF1 family protein [Steroidobacteraceae bacterium]|nr:SURF1 family protein [Steroidobacteraceae bacterium]
MRLRIANRVFAPRPWAVLVTAATLAAFVSLGWWQIGRGREKQALVESFARGTQTSVKLADDVTVDELPRYQHVRAEGRYDPTRQVLVDNMPSQAGRPGYRVLTPFRREGSDRLLLVDRGWVPLGESRDALPPIDVSSEFRAVAGRLDELPAPGVRVGQPGTPGDQRWPRVLNFPRTEDLEQALGEPVESRIVLLDVAAPDGFERIWRPALPFGPERHLGYAIQWFALAIATLVIFIALSLQRTGSDAGAGAGAGTTPDDKR